MPKTTPSLTEDRYITRFSRSWKLRDEFRGQGKIRVGLVDFIIDKIYWDDPNIERNHNCRFFTQLSGPPLPDTVCNSIQLIHTPPGTTIEDESSLSDVSSLFNSSTIVGGGGTGNASSYKIPVGFSTSGPITAAAILANQSFISVEVEIISPFDGTPSFRVGDSVNSVEFMSQNEADWSTLGSYCTVLNKFYETPSNVIVGGNSGSSTSGSAIISFTVV